MHLPSPFKLVAAFATILGLILGFLERKYAPNFRVTSDSPRYPRWLAWLGWTLAAVGAIAYIPVDFISQT